MYRNLASLSSQQSRNVAIDALEQYVDAIGGQLKIGAVKGNRKTPWPQGVIAITPDLEVSRALSELPPITVGTDIARGEGRDRTWPLLYRCEVRS